METNKRRRTGIAGVKEIYRNRDQRAKELKAQGKRVMGYFCSFAPAEIMAGAGFLPYRIIGNVEEPITEASIWLETAMCNYVRSCVDVGLKGGYNHLDGVVSSHTCDNVERIDDKWYYLFKPGYMYSLDLPRWLHGEPTREFFKAELNQFKESLEKFSGKTISSQILRQQVKLYNQTRALVRELYGLRKPDPPLLSGAEMLETIVATMSIPAEEANELLREVISEVKERKDSPQRGVRVLIWGCEIDNTAFMNLVEGSGANVVMDDLCLGSRYYWWDVEPTEDPLDGLAARYIEKISCPVICKERLGTQQEYLEETFGYLKDYTREYNIKGVILYVLRRCDTFAYWVPDLRDYLRGNGLEVLHLEDDYTLTTMEQLKTRIQAFIEMIS